MRRRFAFMLMLCCSTTAFSHDGQLQQKQEADKIQRHLESEAAAEKLRNSRKLCWNGTYVYPPGDCPRTPSQQAADSLATEARNRMLNEARIREENRRNCEQAFDTPGLDFATVQAARGMDRSALVKVAIAAHKSRRSHFAKACLDVASTRAFGEGEALAASLVGDGYRAIEDHAGAIELYTRSLRLNGVDTTVPANPQGARVATSAEIAKARAELQRVREQHQAVRLLQTMGSRTHEQVRESEARLIKAERELKALEGHAASLSPSSPTVGAGQGRPSRYNWLADYRASLGLAESQLALRRPGDARHWALRARSLEGKFAEHPDARALNEAEALDALLRRMGAVAQR